MRDILDKLDNILTEKARGLLYRNPGDQFFQGNKENPTAELTFNSVDYFPSQPGAYADYEEMSAAQQQINQQYPNITWVNKPTQASKAFAVLTFDGPAQGEKTHFGKFFGEIKQDMTGFWKNNELPGGWQLNKAASLKGSYYKLKPSDLYPLDSTFDNPSDILAEIESNPKNNPAVPKIVPGMQQLLSGKFPIFEDVGEMATAIRDDLGETIGPIALIQGMNVGTGAEAARKDILGPKGSYAGSKINFPASKINGLVDSYLIHPSGIEIGISSKGEKGATASVKNIADGIEVAREKGMNDLLKKYAKQVELIEQVGQLSSVNFPLIMGIMQNRITRTQAETILYLIKENVTDLDAVDMPDKDRAVLTALRDEYRPKANPRYNVGYHILSSLARQVVTEINKDPVFGEACLKFLNISPIIQLHMNVRESGENLAVSGFTSKYPPNFQGTVGLDASKVYAATGTNGRVTFSYNGGGNEDTDVAYTGPATPEKIDQVQQKRSSIKASGTKEKPSEPDEKTLGRKKRR